MKNLSKPTRHVQWGATVAATFASTYALDAIAAGMALRWSRRTF